MIVERTENPMWLSNSYLVADPDPGHRRPDRRQRRDRAAGRAGERDGIEITHVLVTHPHADHVAGLAEAPRGARQPAARRPRRDRRGARRGGRGDPRRRGRARGRRPPRQGALHPRPRRRPPRLPDRRHRRLHRRRPLQGDGRRHDGARAPAASPTSKPRCCGCSSCRRRPSSTPATRSRRRSASERDDNPFVRIWRGLDATGEEQVTVWDRAGDPEALGPRLRRRQQGLGPLRRLRRRRDRRRLPGRPRLTPIAADSVPSGVGTESVSISRYLPRCGGCARGRSPGGGRSRPGSR